MSLHVERELHPIKAGWAARAPRLRMAAHGRTREIADANLERTIHRFLAPFRRTGTLEQELDLLRLRRDGDDLTIALIDAPTPDPAGARGAEDLTDNLLTE